MDDLISRQDSINTALEFFVEFLGGAFHEKDQKTLLQRMNDLPSIETEQDREFMKLTVRNSNDRPYYSIIYLEVDDNGVGHDFEGYSSYSLDVISDYLKKYFIPSAEPERKKGKWIYYDPNGFKCSRCGRYLEIGCGDVKMNFCPHCGSYNGGEQE